MKKLLESELMTIAHNILKLKGKEDIDKLYLETQKLYERLTILKFYEKNKSIVETDYPTDEFEKDLISEFDSLPKDSKNKEKDNEVAISSSFTLAEEKVQVEKKVEVEQKVEDDKSKDVIEVIEKESNKIDLLDFKKEEIPVENKNKTIKHEKIEEYLFDDYEDPEFIVKNKISSKENVENEKIEEVIEKIDFQEKVEEVKDFKIQEIELKTSVENDTKDDLDIIKKIVEEAQLKVDALKSERSLSLNDSILKGINIGLNDRIGFVKHLFNGSNEDYNRVISQLSTIETFKEAHEFINIHIKPDYNKWEGKEDYEIRFLNLIEKKYL